MTASTKDNAGNAPKGNAAKPPPRKVKASQPRSGKGKPAAGNKSGGT